jgi:hypothetical protein
MREALAVKLAARPVPAVSWRRRQPLPEASIGRSAHALRAVGNVCRVLLPSSPRAASTSKDITASSCNVIMLLLGLLGLGCLSAIMPRRRFVGFHPSAHLVFVSAKPKYRSSRPVASISRSNFVMYSSRLPYARLRMSTLFETASP